MSRKRGNGGGNSQSRQTRSATPKQPPRREDYVCMGASTVPGAAKSNAETRDGHDGQARTEVKRRSLWGIVWRVGIAIVTILGAGASGATIYSAFGPLWPTQPDIEALSTPADTPLEAQFEITNKSALFSVTDVVVS